MAKEQLFARVGREGAEQEKNGVGYSLGGDSYSRNPDLYSSLVSSQIFIWYYVVVDISKHDCIK